MEAPSAIANGFEFAERLHELLQELGPADFSRAEKEALADHLISCAVQWVRAQNLIAKTGAV